MPTLDWIGKKAVVKHHLEVPYRLLKCDGGLSVGEPGEGNLLVQGDNLEALKALLPYYGGKVKCIYIDPPYNTGNEGWVYNDNVNSPEIRQWLGKVVGREAEDLSRHDKWLCMMYPRLVLLRQFLREDGAVFISVDDSEVAHLRDLMDEIFGAKNFVVNVVWQKVYSPRMDAKSFSSDHDHIVVYAKSQSFQVRKVSFTQNQKQFSLIDKETGFPYRRRQWRKEGSGSRRTDRPNLYYAIAAPDGKKVFPIRPDGSDGRWRGNYDYFKKLETDKLIEWVKQDGIWQIYVKQYGKKQATRPPSSIWFQVECGHNHEAAEEIKEIIGSNKFPTPKPVRLVSRILEIASNEDSIILDSFAGSGTTGHAVLHLNKGDGNRRFILVEMEEKIAQDITAERLKRVIKGYGDTPGLGGGFRFCRLGPTLFNEKGEIREEVGFSDLAHHVYFTETGEPMPKRPDKKTPLLGVHNGRAVYLLFNGILDDKRPKSGNVLTGETLKLLPPHEGPKTVYGTACRLGAPRLRREGVTFRQIPYEIRVK